MIVERPHKTTKNVFKGSKHAPVARDGNTAEYGKLLPFQYVDSLGVAQTDMGIFWILIVFAKTEYKFQSFEFFKLSSSTNKFSNRTINVFSMELPI